MCFSRAAGASDEKARDAAEEIAAFENRLASIENRLIRLEVLSTIVLTGVVSLVVKTYLLSPETDRCKFMMPGLPLIRLATVTKPLP